MTCYMPDGNVHCSSLSRIDTTKLKLEQKIIEWASPHKPKAIVSQFTQQQMTLWYENTIWLHVQLKALKPKAKLWVPVVNSSENFVDQLQFYRFGSLSSKFKFQHEMQNGFGSVDYRFPWKCIEWEYMAIVHEASELNWCVLS